MQPQGPPVRVWFETIGDGPATVMEYGWDDENAPPAP